MYVCMYVCMYIYICVCVHVVIPTTFSHLPHCAEQVRKQRIVTSKALRKCFLSKLLGNRNFQVCGLWQATGALLFAIKQSQPIAT